MISVVLPVRNSPKLTADCLDALGFSLEQFTRDDVEILLIDDDSDPDCQIIEIFKLFKDFSPFPTKIIKLNQRHHFLGACNYGLYFSRGDFILIVSNDMLITPSYIHTLVKVMSADAKIGILRGLMSYADGFPDLSVSPPLPVRDYEDIILFSDYVARYYQNSARNVSYVGFDSVLIRREVIDAIGILDPSYFGYFGEIDYGLRCELSGFSLQVALGAWLYHLGSGHIHYEISATGIDRATALKERTQLVNSAYQVFHSKWHLHRLGLPFSWYELLKGQTEVNPDLSKMIDFARVKEQGNLDLFVDPKQINLDACQIIDS